MDWRMLEKLAPRTRIYVQTDHRTECYFERADADRLFCSGEWVQHKRAPDMVFDRKDVRDVGPDPDMGPDPYDYSKGFLSLVLGAGAGSGVDSAGRPLAFGGVKVGGPFSLDLQFDRIQGRNGFSVEGSPLLPLFRVPRFHGGGGRFVKLFAEPGLGYRAGDGSFGTYASGKIMAALLSDTWRDSGWGSPYVEFQRRFPINSPLQGDNRITVGMMVALCAHCGFN